ncbi:MAG: HIT family protein [Clostridia bacterium]|nr:HIT family protein [Clostridia bacterium]
MKNCLFCNRKNITTDIVYEDDELFAFYDIDPINEGHILLVPKDHYKDADEIPDDLLARLAAVSKKIVSALKEVYHPDGYTVMQNGGKFNDVGHYHLHIFPRNEDDGFGWTDTKDAPQPSAGKSDKLKDLLSEKRRLENE